MQINFNEIDEITIPCMNNGQGMMSVRMHVGDKGKAILTKIHKGGSIGLHPHPASDDVNFVLPRQEEQQSAMKRKNSLLPYAAMFAQGVHSTALPTPEWGSRPDCSYRWKVDADLQNALFASKSSPERVRLPKT